MGFARQRSHQRNENLERLLNELNGILGPAEEKIAEKYAQPKYPVVLVVGNPRSGSTLVLQWLAATGQFAYPSNLLARFYGALYIGAKVQLLLTDPTYDFNKELFDPGHEISFSSTLGKTRGALAPSEFWHFWRRFIPNSVPRYLHEEEEKAIQGEEFAAELAAVESVFDKPFAMKAIILQYNLAVLSSFLEKALFLWIKRHPFYNIQSILKARENYFGTRDGWWSVKPREYDQLKDLDPFGQTAGQVHYTTCAIEEGLAQIEPRRSLTVSYEDFCRNPEQVYHQITDKLAEQGCEIDRNYTGPSEFRDSNQIRVSDDDRKAIIQSYKKISGCDLEP